MPVNSEAESIFKQAYEMIGKIQPKDSKAERDVAGLLLLAIKKAGGSYPLAEEQLAWVYFLLREHSRARQYAESALKAEPNSWLAQYVILGYAFAEIPGFFANGRFQKELKKLVTIFSNVCMAGITDAQFAYSTEVLMSIADIAATKGVGSMRFVYEAIASAPQDTIQKTNVQNSELAEQRRLIAQARLVS